MSSTTNQTDADRNHLDIALISAGMHRNQVSPDAIRIRDDAGRCLIDRFHTDAGDTEVATIIPPVYPTFGWRREKFQRRLDDDGQWRVVDTHTGRTAELGSRQVSGLSKSDAVEMVGIFNAPNGSLS